MEKERPFASYKTYELNIYYEKFLSDKDIGGLEALQLELSCRKRKAALELATKVNKALKMLSRPTPIISRRANICEQLKNGSFHKTLRAWRVYANRLHDKPEKEAEIRVYWKTIYEKWRNEDERYFILNDDEMKKLDIQKSDLSGILSYFGYHTHVKEEIRRITLLELYNATIPPVVNHREWGEPKSQGRYIKITDTLSGLAYPHRHQNNFKKSVAIWDEDYQWFLDTVPMPRYF